MHHWTFTVNGPVNFIIKFPTLGSLYGGGPMHHQTNLMHQAAQVLCLGSLRTWSRAPSDQSGEIQTADLKSF